MHKNPLSHRGLACALAAVLAVAAPGAPLVHAAARLSNAALLAAQLPNGETLSSAPTRDLSAAVRSAAAKRPSAAGEFVRLAILAKTPKRRSPACGQVSDMVTAGIAGAPGQAREISEMAMSVAPDCSEAISQAVRNPSLTPTGGVQTTGAGIPGSTTSESNNTSATGTTNGVGDGSFGAGFGPGFPGSPGFSGSSPSGASAISNGGFPLPTPAPPATS